MPRVQKESESAAICAICGSTFPQLIDRPQLPTIPLAFRTVAKTNRCWNRVVRALERPYPALAFRSPRMKWARDNLSSRRTPFASRVGDIPLFNSAPSFCSLFPDLCSLFTVCRLIASNSTKKTSCQRKFRPPSAFSSQPPASFKQLQAISRGTSIPSHPFDASWLRRSSFTQSIHLQELPGLGLPV